MNTRTDLALEAFETLSDTKVSISQGIRKDVSEIEGFSVTTIEVLDKDAAEQLGKPMGKYITIDLKALMRREDNAFLRACTAVSEVLKDLLKENQQGLVLVAGLGNRAITPDAVGPKTTENIVVTRHLVEQVPEYFSSYRQVAAVAPGVLGITGIETGEIVKGVMEKVGPKTIIAVDALAAKRLSRLLSTIQISSSGIVPGSGVGNARSALNEDTLGVPVIAIGVPTVVDGKTLAMEIEKQTGIVSCEALDDLKTPVVVTTNEIDRQVSDVSRVIGYGINKALHPQLTIEDIDLFLS